MVGTLPERSCPLAAHRQATPREPDSSHALSDFSRFDDRSLEVNFTLYALYVKCACRFSSGLKECIAPEGREMR
jgi:hypothetical protein